MSEFYRTMRKLLAEHGSVMPENMRALVEGEALALRAFLKADTARQRR